MSLRGANVCFWYHYALQWCNILTRYVQWTLTNDLFQASRLGERACCRHDLSVARSLRRSDASIASDVLERLTVGERRRRRESARARDGLPGAFSHLPHMQRAIMRQDTGPPSTPPRAHLEGRSTKGRHLAARFPITRVESRRQKSAEYRLLPTSRASSPATA